MARTPLFARLRRILSPADGALPAPRGELLARRRAFLQAAASFAALSLPGVASVGCAAPGVASQPAVAGKGSDPERPSSGGLVAIIGGGIAGLHCAYRLKQAGVPVAVYEAQKRTGGRTFTGRGLFGAAPQQICELGGELIDTGHTTLFALAEEFGIKLDDRLADEAPGIERETYYIAGARIPEATIVAQFKEVAGRMRADLEAAENDDARLAELDDTSLDAYLNEVVPHGRHPELHTILQVAYRGEYGLETSRQSALNILYLIGSDEPEPFRIFGESDERFHAHDGNDTFAARLAERLTSEIHLEHRLVSARDAAGGGYQLDFVRADGSSIEVSAARVVFALPFTLLREVDLEGIALADDKRQAIAELSYGTNAKVMLGFAKRLWREHASAGTMITDFGVQQTWETTVGYEGAHGILTNYLGGEQGIACGAGEAEAWAQSVLPDLERIWPGISATYGEAVRMHWPTVPTAKGSYGCPTVGQVTLFAIAGRREGNAHFCGEHTSLDFQGWIEGAAETGGLVAAEILDELGIPKPQPLVQALAHKLLIPQSCYRASADALQNPLRRRRQAREALHTLHRQLFAAAE